MPHYHSYPQDFHKVMAIHVFCLPLPMPMLYKLRHGKYRHRSSII